MDAVPLIPIYCSPETVKRSQGTNSLPTPGSQLLTSYYLEPPQDLLGVLLLVLSML